MSGISWRPVATAALLVALAAGVVAAFNVETPERSTVSAIARSEPSQRLITLEGTLRTVGLNQLRLEDATGEIRLNTCPGWYRPLFSAQPLRARVVGHLASRATWPNNHPVFLVYRLRAQHYAELVLRYDDGVPVWHRYRTIPGQRLQREIAQEMPDLSY